jgi:hypothetical protein
MIITINFYVAMGDLFWNINLMILSVQTFVIDRCQLKDDVSTCRTKCDVMAYGLVLGLQLNIHKMEKMNVCSYWEKVQITTWSNYHSGAPGFITWVHPPFLVGFAFFILLEFCVLLYVCVLFVLVLCLLYPICCQCLWIVHSWFPIRFSLKFIAYWAKIHIATR